MKAKTMFSSISSGILRNYIVTLLVTFSVSSLSALLVDLSYAPFLNQNPSWPSVNIGGGGLTDGVLFSGLFALVWATFYVSVLSLFVEILRTSHRKDSTLKKDIERDRKRDVREAELRTSGSFFRLTKRF